MALPNYLPGYAGFKICPSWALTVNKVYEVPRTWKERLFTWPWRPLQTTRTEVRTEPSDQIVRMGDTIFCHPSIADKIRESLTSEIPRSDGIKW